MPDAYTIDCFIRTFFALFYSFALLVVLLALAGCPNPYRQLQAGGSSGTAATATLEDPPIMNNPLNIQDICPEDLRWPTPGEMAGRDVKIILPKDRVCKKEGTLGGTSESAPAHNIWVVGGELEVTSGAGGGGLTVRWWDGTALFEGVYVNINNTQNDGIRTYYAVRDARVVIQNSFIRGMGYGNNGHGDLFHAQGSGAIQKELVMQNVRGDLVNQGIFVPSRTSGHGVRRLVMDHVELRLDIRYKFGKISTMIFAGTGPENGDSAPQDGQSFNEVYLNWWYPHYSTTQNRTDITVPPVTGYDSKGCAIFSDRIKRSHNITGAWCRGSPAGGTFVPLDKIGRNYDRSYFTKRQ